MLFDLLFFFLFFLSFIIRFGSWLVLASHASFPYSCPFLVPTLDFHVMRDVRYALDSKNVMQGMRGTRSMMPYCVLLLYFVQTSIMTFN